MTFYFMYGEYLKGQLDMFRQNVNFLMIQFEQ